MLAPSQTQGSFMCKPDRLPLPFTAVLLALTAGMPAASNAGETLSPAVVPTSASAATAGFYKMKLGDFTVVALSDGTFDLPGDRLLIEDKPGSVKSLMDRARLPTPTPTTVNAYLIDTGTQRILVDAGAGDLLGSKLGGLRANLRAAGYRPEGIDKVLLTHLHPDHVGGIASQGRPTFPNSTVYADARESAFWLDHSNFAKVDPSVQGAFAGASASLQPYIAIGRFKTFQSGDELVPGVTAIAASGHTAGHTAYRIESRGETLLLWGDLLHVAAVQFRDPNVTIHYDSIPVQARAARERAFADAAEKGYWVAAAHIPFPGIGHVRRADEGYVWEPLGGR
jgi:glyoxylase-like metal-dependent hydrolase (beta-lactamase superfamily II)